MLGIESMPAQTQKSHMKLGLDRREASQVFSATNTHPSSSQSTSTVTDHDNNAGVLDRYSQLRFFKAMGRG